MADMPIERRVNGDVLGTDDLRTPQRQDCDTPGSDLTLQLPEARQVFLCLEPGIRAFAVKALFVRHGLTVVAGRSETRDTNQRPSLPQTFDIRVHNQPDER